MPGLRQMCNERYLTALLSNLSRTTLWLVLAVTTSYLLLVLAVPVRGRTWYTYPRGLPIVWLASLFSNYGVDPRTNGPAEVFAL